MGRDVLRIFTDEDVDEDDDDRRFFQAINRPSLVSGFVTDIICSMIRPTVTPIRAPDTCMKQRRKTDRDGVTDRNKHTNTNDGITSNLMSNRNNAIMMQICA